MNPGNHTYIGKTPALVANTKINKIKTILKSPPCVLDNVDNFSLISAMFNVPTMEYKIATAITKNVEVTILTNKYLTVSRN